MTELVEAYIAWLEGGAPVTFARAVALDATLGPETGWWDVAGYALRRAIFTKHFGFAIPTEEAVDALAAHLADRPVIDAGSGTGYLTALLRGRGLDVMAYDNVARDYGFKTGLWARPVPRSAVPAIGRTGRNVLLSWPCYASSFAYRVARAMGAGTVLAYIGEGRSGCTGDDAFHDFLDEAFEQVAEHGLPQWPEIHDRLTIWRKTC